MVERVEKKREVYYARTVEMWGAVWKKFVTDMLDEQVGWIGSVVERIEEKTRLWRR